MSKEDNIRELLDETVEEIVNAEGNPRTWLTWVVYLLARLEEKVTQTGPVNRDSYMEMLDALQDEIRNRSRTGGWN
ncbi:MAG: hypothetical protein C3F07_10010 [Anaerolineales bacterium]|nr:hypothetical protein [Anaerolineae bacterium]PWB73179.1 MAG: hypothetical protein C3F07_10010 [Anaerolineales bacterium]